MAAIPRLPQSCFGLDIGGTLCKISYFEKYTHSGEDIKDIELREKVNKLITSQEPYGETGKRDTELEFDDEALGGRVYLMRFESRKMEAFIEMVKASTVVNEDTIVCCTGGGSRKYAALFKEKLNLIIRKADELGCLVDGINFSFHRRMKELYKVDHSTFITDGLKHFVETPRLDAAFPFPYLLVNIGSGVSILKVTSASSHERVGGTSLGGATYFGLCCKLTGCASFDEVLELASRGDAKRVDLLVSDIYGGGLDEYGLSGDVVAASFGKLTNPEVRESARPEDMARALLDMITNNIASLAMLNALRHGTDYVVFAGNFLRQNRISIARLSYAVEFWSGGKRQALFLAHEGYLGALGAMLHGKPGAAH
eukprot:m.237373 g.237373  ORF g.237373 m.237373 type:complete len:369 (-) comp13126_c0_seq1:111-1217(-)